MTPKNPSFAALSAGTRPAGFRSLEEAARYALLQRLAPALQHQMMGLFQALSLLVATLEHRLVSGKPDLAGLRNLRR